MNLEEKELLIKDICARLSCGIKATTTSNGWRDVYIVSGYKDDRIYLDCPVYDEGDDEWLIESVKPYLRPMSSMTDEEKKEIEEILEYSFHVTDKGNIVSNDWRDGAVFTSQYDAFKIMDFCNKHHLDYRGLIPMGLALEAKEGMYNFK